MTTAITDRVLMAIKQIDFPASKEEIVQVAEQHGIDQEAMSTLRAIPPVAYRNKDEVLASIDLDRADDVNPGRRREHTHAGLADHEKDHSPSPIEGEVGANERS